VLDDVAVRPFLEQPAGKDGAPLLIARIEHDQLDESAGFLRHFPLGGAFARAQPHHRAADAQALPRLQFDIADQPVALVEQPQHRHALLHRGHALIDVILALRRACLGQRAGIGGGRRRLRLAMARGQRAEAQRRAQQGQARRPGDLAHRRHAASGVQG
jgi:hypothetical protein